MHLERITVEPDKMGGVPCIRGLRVPVATVVGMVVEGMTAEEILEAYPYLEPADGAGHGRAGGDRGHDGDAPGT